MVVVVVVVVVRFPQNLISTANLNNKHYEKQANVCGITTIILIVVLVVVLLLLVVIVAIIK